MTMSNEEPVVLNHVRITSIEEKGVVTYQFLSKDSEGRLYIQTFAMKSFYQKSMDKYISRLHPVNIKPTEKTDDRRIEERN